MADNNDIWNQFQSSVKSENPGLKVVNSDEDDSGDAGSSGGSNGGMATIGGGSKENLLQDIRSSMEGMQTQMQDTYQGLEGLEVSAKSLDETVIVKMSGTGKFVDIDFTENALQGGMKEFKWRLREAFKTATEEVQKVTQEKTMELLNGMQIPDEIKNLNVNEEEQG